MFGNYPANPDESLCAAIAWTLWTQGRLATDLLAGALPGIERHVYWTPPFYYLVLAGWQGLWGSGLLSVRCLSLVVGSAVLVLLWQRRRSVGPAAWTASALVLYDPLFQRAASMARMDVLAIALTVAALTAVERSRSRRGCLVAGALAATAFLTHPLGAAALIAVGLTCLCRGRPTLVAFLLGSTPPLLAWTLYICLDVDAFAAQLQLQMAIKTERGLAPLGNLRRLAVFYGRNAPFALVSCIGGAAGLVIYRRRLGPWLVGAACLTPVVLFSGELIYPAYLAPFSAVGLSALLAPSRGGRRALAVTAAVTGIATAADPPPLAGIHPRYEGYCDYISAHLAPGHTALLALVPDPWFGLRQRGDLRLRFAPPVRIPTPQLHAYLRLADDVVVGGYNPPGFAAIVDGWDELARPGQRLWIMQQGRLYDYEEVRGDVRIRR